jgi:hypothetical protein
VAELREVIAATGALAEVEARISARAEEAHKAVQDDALRPEARQALEALAVAAVVRQT